MLAVFGVSAAIGILGALRGVRGLDTSTAEICDYRTLVR